MVEEFWSKTPDELLRELDSSCTGLSNAVAQSRSTELLNKPQSPLKQGLLLFFRQYRNPLVLLLVFALILSFSTGTYSDGIIIFIILFLSGIFGFIQEHRASKAAAELRALIQIKTHVLRDGKEFDLPVAQIVPGDILKLEAGDIVAADGLILEAKDLYMNESVLTGESFPSEKNVGILLGETTLIDRKNSVFRGTNVTSGTATVLAVAIGSESELGKIETQIGSISEETAFEKGVKRFGYLLMRVALIMSAIILIVNLTMGRPTLDSLLFALALAVGITPELLPAIVTITLSAGAKRLSEKKVIVKKLASIQNLGSIDVLCSDKTGTLTDGEVKVYSCVAADGKEDPLISQYAYLNSNFESGYTNPIDAAIVKQFRQDVSGFSKFDEVPYDFIRKRLSVVVANKDRHLMITKGALKNTLDVCEFVRLSTNETVPLKDYLQTINADFQKHSANGYRVIGICYKDVTSDPVINREDETAMTFLGFILLYDPPKENIRQVIDDLKNKKVSLKIITGDNTLIARNIALQLGISADRILSGRELHQLDDTALPARVDNIDLFSETEPSQKERIVRALQSRGHVVGYLGDGINDASALKVADVGISVNNAVDVAKESADVILMEKNLDVIGDGIVQGRKTYMNTMKYLLISVCSNFGNMFSLAVLSLIYPHLPLLPAQILLINFLTDLPAFAIVSDTVDAEFLLSPRKWDLKLIRNFMIVFGLESSLFDFITFGFLAWFMALPVESVRTGWFMESVISAVLILLVIRTHRTFVTSLPGKALTIASAFVILVVLIIPYLTLSSDMGLNSLPLWLTSVMVLIAFSFALLAEFTKKMIFRKMHY